MSTLTIHHIGYLVKKIVPAIRSFEALGFQVAREVTRDDIREVDICFLEKDGYRVELVSPYSATSVVAGLLKKYKNCPYHICYETSHFEEALEELKEHSNKKNE